MTTEWWVKFIDLYCVFDCLFASKFTINLSINIFAAIQQNKKKRIYQKVLKIYQTAAACSLARKNMKFPVATTLWKRLQNKNATIKNCIESNVKYEMHTAMEGERKRESGSGSESERGSPNVASELKWMLTLKRAYRTVFIGVLKWVQLKMATLSASSNCAQGEQSGVKGQSTAPMFKQR